jgi:hypothetical protein
MAAPHAPLWWTWFRRVTVGEFLGFAAPATVGAASTGWPSAAAVPALLAAGAVEGAVLGAAQAHVLGRALPALDRGRFVAATAAGAVLAYAIGLVPSALGGALLTLPTWLLVGLAAAGGTALLAAIGTAQWLVLRHVLPRSAWWIATTAGAWAAGLLAFAAVAPPLWQPGRPALLTAAIAVLGGLVMAAVVAGLTGWAAVRLLRAAVSVGGAGGIRRGVPTAPSPRHPAGRRRHV